MAIEGDKLYEFKKTLRRLRGFRGSGTELISVYIGAGSPIHDTAGKLREEMSQASNIKSKSTKLNVTGALERIIGYMRMFKSTPKNGIAIFCGNIGENAAKIEIELITIEPPLPLRISAYRCDSKFFLDPLEEMVETKDAYGLIVMDGREATLAILRGKNTEVVKKLVSLAHAKVNKGGQSQRRFQRLVEESIEYYYKRIGEAIDEHFLGKVKGIVVGGPGPAKDYFVKANTYNYQIKLLGVVDTGYTDEYGIREVLAKSENIIEEQESIREKNIVDNFIREISRNGLATYGYNDVKHAIISAQAGKVLVSEEMEDKIYLYACISCGEEKEVVSKDKQPEKSPCEKCGKDDGMRLKETKLLVDHVIELARNHNIDIEMISDNTTEGAQFYIGFGGVGAMLRYKK